MIRAADGVQDANERMALRDQLEAELRDLDNWPGLLPTNVVTDSETGYGPMPLIRTVAGPWLDGLAGSAPVVPDFPAQGEHAGVDLELPVPEGDPVAVVNAMSADGRHFASLTFEASKQLMDFLTPSGVKLLDQFVLDEVDLAAEKWIAEALVAAAAVSGTRAAGADLAAALDEAEARGRRSRGGRVRRGERRGPADRAEGAGVDVLRGPAPADLRFGGPAPGHGDVRRVGRAPAVRQRLHHDGVPAGARVHATGRGRPAVLPEPPGQRPDPDRHRHRGLTDGRVRGGRSRALRLASAHRAPEVPAEPDRRGERMVQRFVNRFGSEASAKLVRYASRLADPAQAAFYRDAALRLTPDPAAAPRTRGTRPLRLVERTVCADDCARDPLPGLRGTSRPVVCTEWREPLRP